MCPFEFFHSGKFLGAFHVLIRNAINLLNFDFILNFFLLRFLFLKFKLLVLDQTFFGVIFALLE